VIRSLGYAALTTVLCLAIGYPVAYAIGRASERRRNLLLMAVMVPFWTSFLIRTYAWVTILKSQGLLNSLAMQFQLIQQPLEMLYTPGAVVLGLVYTFLPFMILPIYASVEKLDGALVEAALDLGAGPLRAFARVIVPLTMPGIAAGVLLVFVPSLGLYAVNDILGGGRVDMIGNIIENQFKGNARNWPFGAALGTALLLGFGLVYGLVNRRLRDETSARPVLRTGL
jgi:spermidine/putrescine transport system permease protein